jgi:hypothetical protein
MLPSKQKTQPKRPTSSLCCTLTTGHFSSPGNPQNTKCCFTCNDDNNQDDYDDEDNNNNKALPLTTHTSLPFAYSLLSLFYFLRGQKSKGKVRPVRGNEDSEWE